MNYQPLGDSMIVERLRERRYRLMLRLPFVWRYAWRKGTWEVVEVSHLTSDGEVIES